MGLLFIEDGYTRRAFIASVKGQHGELEVTYRPMLAEERDNLFSSLERKQPREQVRTIAGVLAAQVTWWSAQGKEGMVPISAENVRRLQPSLFNKLYNLVNGSRPTDAFPDGSMPDEEDDFRDDLQGIVGPVREERQEKNSGAA